MHDEEGAEKGTRWRRAVGLVWFGGRELKKFGQLPSSSRVVLNLLSCTLVSSYNQRLIRHLLDSGSPHRINLILFAQSRRLRIYQQSTGTTTVRRCGYTYTQLNSSEYVLFPLPV
jgi:hypothetical protein